MIPEPSALDLIDTATTAIQGRADKTADLTRGSDYESLVGPPAVIYSREARRDTDLFDATKFHTAVGDDLTLLVKQRFGVDRYLDTRGNGTASVSRSTNSGGSGTIWAGTRITIFGSEPKRYRTTKDTPVSSTALSLNLDIEAVEIGPGSRANQTANLRFDDQLWDATWTVNSLTCGDGTRYEAAPDLIARVRAGRRDARVGQRKAIRDTCAAAGAANILILRADFGGDAADHGLNVCYVGDLGYSGSPSLVKACTLALRNARVLGDHMQVLPMGRASIAVSADVYLRDIPQTLDTIRLEAIHRAAITQYLGGPTGGFTFAQAGFASAIFRNTVEVQNVIMASPAADVGILVAGAFPPVLYRYVISDIALRYHGP